jgi:ankyrin repeat protein
MTPIHLAFRYFDSNKGGDIDILIYLLNLKGIDINTKGQCRHTILHSVCENINRLPLYIFEHLVEISGGNINVLDNFFNTPIHSAFRFFDPNKGGDINKLIFLLNLKGLDVNKKDEDGCTILHSVCWNIKPLPLDIIKYLIEIKGLKIDCLDKYGNTPLHYLNGDLSSKDDSNVSQTAEYLVQKGIPINHKNLYKLTVLDAFSQHKSTYPLTYGVLIKNGAKLGKDC